MKISFHGAAGCVTGSCFLIEYASTRFLVDCGMFQGNKTLKENNYAKFGFEPKTIDFVLLTHAHIDHTGLLPKLVKHGFTGPVFTSSPTAELLGFLLMDSAHIQEFEVERKNRRLARKGLDPIEPIYTEAHAEEAISRFKKIERGSVCEPAPGCKVRFRNAGHVLGSAFIEVEVEEAGKKKTLVFSGDLGENDHPIVKDPEIPSDTDILVVESTYGNRARTPEDKVERLAHLAKIIKDTHARGGNLVIPAFALERTQDLMHDISTLMGNGDIPQIDVIVDSPLAIRLTKVFAAHPEAYDKDAQEIVREQGDLFRHPRFRFTLSAQESMDLNGQFGLILISASGMADAGRIKHHLKHNLWRTDATILFVGYQANGTLGRILLEGAQRVRIHGEEIQVKAKIERIIGYSGHADQSGLVKWVEQIKNIKERVFIVHGEDDSRDQLKKLLAAKLKVPIDCPDLGEVFDLSAGKAIHIPVDTTMAEDSHNLYADLMLNLAEFMRGNHTEDERQKKLASLLKSIKN